ncbi:hypothetical protein TNCV_2076601 [Trichonephila clavipes]|nr:hypothetical protein TNCV_2076601 [Trichonephila clavipes]
MWVAPRPPSLHSPPSPQKSRSSLREVLQHFGASKSGDLSCPVHVRLTKEGLKTLLIPSTALSYTRAFGDGPRNFEPWSRDVDDT